MLELEELLLLLEKDNFCTLWVTEVLQEPLLVQCSFFSPKNIDHGFFFSLRHFFKSRSLDCSFFQIERFPVTCLSPSSFVNLLGKSWKIRFNVKDKCKCKFNLNATWYAA